MSKAIKPAEPSTSIELWTVWPPATRDPSSVCPGHELYDGVKRVVDVDDHDHSAARRPERLRESRHGHRSPTR
jgi:hypothetical protein